MHRVNDPGDGFADGYYHDQALPAAGTVDSADEANSEMMELINIVEMAGDTLAASAAADAAAGWHQCYDAIFQNGHLTDAAIDELSFAVMKSGQINITSGTQAWIQDVSGVAYADTAINASAGIVNNEVSLKYQGARLKATGRGINYYNGPGTSTIDDVYFRVAHYPVSTIGTTWSQGVVNGSWVWDEDYTTTIPSSCPVYNIYSRAWNTSTNRWNVYPTGGAFEAVGGYWVIRNLTITNSEVSIQPDTLQVSILYDAASLTV